MIEEQKKTTDETREKISDSNYSQFGVDLIPTPKTHKSLGSEHIGAFLKELLCGDLGIEIFIEPKNEENEQIEPKKSEDEEKEEKEQKEMTDSLNMKNNMLKKHLLAVSKNKIETLDGGPIKEGDI